MLFLLDVSSSSGHLGKQFDIVYILQAISGKTATLLPFYHYKAVRVCVRIPPGEEWQWTADENRKSHDKRRGAAVNRKLEVLQPMQH